ncbi:TPA: hypothetical protein KPW83_003222 [Clostridioides difficile]|uniref:Lipoprotein n=1 Tax=Clostridioides difficile TaxID=1496 RepID=A0AB74QC47_CLODI|nr:hypothetical protein [Clostridioides difficile]MBG0001170.1 hypothetical protein [Clostridioides difficile]MBY1312895.1 hypothetical protein [Clostridioides difficile]MBY1797677.1 hypothetical protein [Clostridioides difficile]MBY2027610.1 hypothetical protein [Clostridioides difficile]MBZ0502433.1 hypothetical protein [Clostridioides difficile]
MNKIVKKSISLMIILTIFIFMLTACEKDEQPDSVDIQTEDKNEIKIDEGNAKVLNIGKSEIINIDEGDKVDTSTKVENNSTFNISNVELIYNEYDDNKKIISSDSKALLDMTLMPGKVAYIECGHKTFVKGVEVYAYEYEAEGKIVYVNLKENTINIRNNNIKLENSSQYEVLSTSELKKVNESNEGITYQVKVKNSSSKDLGNIILKTAEVNENGEYLTVNRVPSYKILKPSEETDIDILCSTKAKSVEIVGYTYDDIKEKANVDIDLKSHKVKIDK